MGYILVTETDGLNATDLQSEIYEYEKSCGYNNCPQTILNFSQASPTQTSVYILFSSLITLGVLAILTTLFFMDNINEAEDDIGYVEKKSKNINAKIVGNLHENVYFSRL